MKVSSVGDATRVQPSLVDRVLFVDRYTGRLIEVYGERLEMDEELAKGVAIAAAILSAVGGALGSRLLRLEISYSSREVTVEVGEGVLKLAVRTL